MNSKSKIIILSFVLIGLCAITGCKDFIEPSVSKKLVTLRAPGNGAQLSTTSVTFWWDSVPGATSYEIQVVSPGFNNIQFLSVDSTVTGKTFTFNLTPGKYQWKMRPINSSSSGNFCAADSFSIDSSLNLSGQTVQIITPANNYISNSLSVSFAWSPMLNVNYYHFSAGSYYVDTLSTNFLYVFPGSGTYTWYIQGTNNASASLATQYTIYVDTTAPPAPTGISPQSGATVTSNPFTLSWTQADDNLSIFPVHDSVYIYRGVNLDTLVVATRPGGTSFTDSLALGTYYWVVRAIDTAGNRKTAGPFNFILQ